MILAVTAALLAFIMTANLVEGNEVERIRNPEFSIQKINPQLIKTPEYHYVDEHVFSSTGGVLSSSFLSLEVEFTYQPKVKTEKNRYIDHVLFTYYLLLNTRSSQHPSGILLVGSVMHDAICAQREKRSVMYIAPSTLDRFFQGRTPSNITQIVYDIGVVISKEGQSLAFRSWRGYAPWWEHYSPISGLILNKNQTPFAPLLWEHYEQICSTNH